MGKKIGRRNSNPAVYWLEIGMEQCVVGCFRGNLEELTERVQEKHAENKKHLADYMNFINAVRAFQEATK